MYFRLGLYYLDAEHPQHKKYNLEIFYQLFKNV